jgi:glucosamine kinase
MSTVLSLSHIMATMPHFLAIDAGGTSTRCLLADSESILARATTGSVKLMRVPEAEATARLHAMLDEVSTAAGVPLSQITGTCIGLAGLTIPAVRAWATLTLAAHVAGEVILCGDEEIALDAAFPSAGGILVIAGTGSNVIGRALDGGLHSAGGWGPILGDEGSGYWIGLESIRAALRAHDHESISPPNSPQENCHSDPAFVEGKESPHLVRSAAHVLAEIQRHFNLTTLPELIALGNHRGDATRPAPNFASLVPTIAACAEQGNPIAVAILRQAGVELATLVALVARKLDAPPNAEPFTLSLEPQNSNVLIAFTGSVLSHIPAVRDAMTKLLARLLPFAQVHPTAIDPLEGALYRARHV